MSQKAKPRVDVVLPLARGVLPTDMLSWLIDNVGSVYDSNISPVQICAYGWSAWADFYLDHAHVTFIFDDPRKATLFKLTWG